MRIFSLICIALLLSGTAVAAENSAASEIAADIESAQKIDGPQEKQQTIRDILLNAISLTGVKYRYGGSSPTTGFDCSGFVRYIFRETADIALPHNARAISQVGKIISQDQLQPGDLVFYNTMRRAFSHVGIYLGNNRFIHAPSSGGGIHIANMGSAYWSERFNGARRIIGSEAIENQH